MEKKSGNFYQQLFILLLFFLLAIGCDNNDSNGSAANDNPGTTTDSRGVNNGATGATTSTTTALNSVRSGFDIVLASKVTGTLHKKITTRDGNLNAAEVRGIAVNSNTVAAAVGSASAIEIWLNPSSQNYSTYIDAAGKVRADSYSLQWLVYRNPSSPQLIPQNEFVLSEVEAGVDVKRKLLLSSPVFVSSDSLIVAVAIFPRDATSTTLADLSTAAVVWQLTINKAAAVKITQQDFADDKLKITAEYRTKKMGAYKTAAGLLRSSSDKYVYSLYLPSSGLVVINGEIIWNNFDLAGSAKDNFTISSNKTKNQELNIKFSKTTFEKDAVKVFYSNPASPGVFDVVLTKTDKYGQSTSTDVTVELWNKILPSMQRK